MSKLRSLLTHEVAIVILLVILAIFLRLFRLDELFTFTYDQGRDMYVLQNIVRGDFTLIGPTTGLPGVFLGPFMYYFLVPGFILGNGSPLAVVKWMLVVITLVSPLFYLLLKRKVSPSQALIGFLLLVLTAGSIEEARQIWNPSLVVPVLLISTFSLFKSKKNQWWLVPALFSYGLSLQTELAYTVFLAPLYGLWILLYANFTGPWLQNMWSAVSKVKSTIQKPIYSWKTILIASVAFGSTLLPQALFDLRNDFLITRSMIRESTDSSKQVELKFVWSKRPYEMLEELHEGLTGRAPGFEYVGVVVVAAALYLLVKHCDDETLFWVGWFFLPLIGMLFHRGNYGYFFGYYITAHYLPALAILILAISKLRQEKYRKIAFASIALLWLALFIRFAFSFYNVAGFQYTMDLQKRALLRARELQQTDRMAVEVYVPNLLPINYQYLNEWIASSNQATALDFGVTDHQEYVLVYERNAGPHSKIFEEWMSNWTRDANCSEPEDFGIVSIKHCLRQPQSEAGS